MTPPPSIAESPEDSFRAIVTGRVQGVGFRWFVQDCAERLGVRGSVANRRDGAVEVQAAGDRDTLDELLAELRRGPSAARVQNVDVDWDFPPPTHDDFRITYG